MSSSLKYRSTVFWLAVDLNSTAMSSNVHGLATLPPESSLPVTGSPLSTSDLTSSAMRQASASADVTQVSSSGSFDSRYRTSGRTPGVAGPACNPANRASKSCAAGSAGAGMMREKVWLKKSISPGSDLQFIARWCSPSPPIVRASSCDRPLNTVTSAPRKA